MKSINRKARKGKTAKHAEEEEFHRDFTFQGFKV
jgi:hypothetical protein